MPPSLIIHKFVRNSYLMAKAEKPKKKAKAAKKETPVKLNMSFDAAIKLAATTPLKKEKKD